MIQCPSCSTKYSSNLFFCTTCKFSPSLIDGFYAWSPTLAHAGSGFKVESFDILSRLEDGNFWFRSRNKLILWAIEKYFPKFSSLMEIGCGTGFVLSAIATQYPSASLVGSEIFVHGLSFAAQRTPNAKMIQLDARAIPFIDEFDIIGAFDVLEHIKEDELVLKNLYKALKPGGGLMISVPQHQWLWSATDVLACHVRRYSRKEISSKLSNAGFEVLRSTSFVSLLLPAMLFSRFQSRYKRNFDPLDEFKISTFVNTVLEKILHMERLMINLGLNFPVGGSRLVIARKKNV